MLRNVSERHSTAIGAAEPRQSAAFGSTVAISLLCAGQNCSDLPGRNVFMAIKEAHGLHLKKQPAAVWSPNLEPELRERRETSEQTSVTEILPFVGVFASFLLLLME